MNACVAIQRPSIYRLSNGFQWECAQHTLRLATLELISAPGMSGILKDLYHEGN